MFDNQPIFDKLWTLVLQVLRFPILIHRVSIEIKKNELNYFGMVHNDNQSSIKYTTLH